MRAIYANLLKKYGNDPSAKSVSKAKKNFEIATTERIMLELEAVDQKIFLPYDSIYAIQKQDIGLSKKKIPNLKSVQNIWLLFIIKITLDI